MRYLLLLLSLALLTFTGQGQNPSHKPAKTVRAAYFDVTPPLRDMPVIRPEDDPNRGENGVIKNESLELEHDSQVPSVTDEASIQAHHGAVLTKGPIVNVEGTGNVNGVYPPDTDGDVGPNHYFQMINLSFAIYDKEGNKLYGPVSNSTLWSGFPGPWTGTNDGDPVVLYDELADRWVATQFAIYTSNGKKYELVAVSTTPDPLGSYYRYAFEFDMLNDYPKLGVWPDGYYGTCHMFTQSFQGMAVTVFEREKMLAGDPAAQMIYFGEYSNKFGYLPADCDGDTPPPAGSPGIIAGVNASGNHKLEVWKCQVDWTTPSNSVFEQIANLSVLNFNPGINGIPQPGTSQKLDDFGDLILFRLPYRNFGTHQVLLCNHAVNAGGKAGIRWYELRDEGSTWTVYQQGTYAPDNEYRWMGSIAMAANGNIALGFCKSSSSTYPSIWYTGRSPEATPGQMNFAEVMIKAGAGSQSSINRWGDYACLSVDPSNDTVFWHTNEYMKSGNWGTRIASFNFEAIQNPTVFAGPDDTICDNILFNTAASAQNYAAVHWETSGDGQFQNPNILDAKYLRGNQDILNGLVTLTVKVTGYQPGTEASDSMLLHITHSPVANAGNDTTVTTTSVQLNGTVQSFSNVLWTSAGDGGFDNASIPDPVYTFGTNDLVTGQVILTLTAGPVAPCVEEDDDQVKITVDVNTLLNETILKQESFAIVPNPSGGKFTVFLRNEASNTARLAIRNIHGDVVLNEVLEGTGILSRLIDLTGLPKGVYAAEAVTGRHSKALKIVIE